MDFVLFFGAYLFFWAKQVLAKFNGDNPQYSNTWVANIEGGEGVAERVAKELGFNFLGQVGTFNGYYKFSRDDHPKVSLRHSSHFTRSLQDLDEVIWAEQQILEETVSKGYLSVKERNMEEELLLSYLNGKAEKSACTDAFSCFSIRRPSRKFTIDLNEGDISKLGSFTTRPVTKLKTSLRWGATENIGLISKKKSSYALQFTDPLWENQWYEHDYRTKEGPVMDHNIVPVYNMGFTGEGVTVGIIDRGVYSKHNDLKRNYLEHLSYDLCLDKPGGEAPGGNQRNPHGTKCAGVVAMEANNGRCGVGIAYNAKFASIRSTCTEPVTTDVRARSLVHSLHDIDIYSNSWGPTDDGKTACIISHLSAVAYDKGITEGRKGKGVIYVHAAGNGALEGDNCAMDCYVNSPKLIVVGAVNQLGKRADYSERCTAIFTVGYTGNRLLYGGYPLEGNVAPGSWDPDDCVTSFIGTSASVPLVSGIIALTLEANPELTYRDVMHLIAMSSEVAPLANNGNSWYKNGRGFFVSNDFGFGLLNAENMVRLATDNWIRVPEKRICTFNIKVDDAGEFSKSQPGKFSFKTDACSSSPQNTVKFLEHVELESVVTFPVRGDISIELESPSKTKSVLLEQRSKDRDPNGLAELSITSLHNWGEDPRGWWTVVVKINPWTHSLKNAYAKEFILKFHGTAEKPAHYNKRRTYAAFRLPDGTTHKS